jgi:hypothetical protein
MTEKGASATSKLSPTTQYIHTRIKAWSGIIVKSIMPSNLSRSDCRKLLVEDLVAKRLGKRGPTGQTGKAGAPWATEGVPTPIKVNGPGG